MNRALADRIVDAVLYEGYILYPYRPSVKNHQRWTFGGLYPEAYCQQTGGSESSENRTECLVRGNADTAIEVVVRFLQLTHRQAGEFSPPLQEWPEGEVPAFRSVEKFRVGSREFHSWQEAEERAWTVEELKLGTLLSAPYRNTFGFPGRKWAEPIESSEPSAAIVGVLAREEHAVQGEVEISAAPVSEGLFRLGVVVRNRAAIEVPASRDDALLRALVSTHLLLGVRGGAFISLVDPPDDCRAAVAECRNVGVWPALVGAPGQADTMLSSPIILYDYPQVAPESPGDLFDSTEIDEILSLRILTLTDDEKRQAAAVDERVRALLERTESLGAEKLGGLHGTMRAPGG